MERWARCGAAPACGGRRDLFQHGNSVASLTDIGALVWFLTFVVQYGVYKTSEADGDRASIPYHALTYWLLTALTTWKPIGCRSGIQERVGLAMIVLAVVPVRSRFSLHARSGAGPGRSDRTVRFIWGPRSCPFDWRGDLDGIPESHPFRRPRGNALSALSIRWIWRSSSSFSLMDSGISRPGARHMTSCREPGILQWRWWRGFIWMTAALTRTLHHYAAFRGISLSL